MRLLLDTVVFLWLITDDSRLLKQARGAILAPGTEVFLSVVSLWEIVVKYQLGRLPLPEAPSRYIPIQRARHLIESLPLDELSVAHLHKLPSIHKDPFDRMLVCQAIEHNLDIVTPDKAILDYPVRTFWS